MRRGGASGPSVPGTLADLKERVEALERALGIRFNVDNQGGSLRVTTNDVGPGDLGIDLEDASGGGARFGSATGSTEIVGATVGVDGGTGAHFGTAGTGPSLEATLADLGVNLNTGQKFVVRDHTGNPVLEVRDDGSVHIKTGTSVVADL